MILKGEEVVVEGKNEEGGTEDEVPVGVAGAEAEDGGMASRGLGEEGVDKDGRPRLNAKTDFQLVGILYI